MAKALKRLRANEAGHAVKMARIRACNMALFFFSMPVSSFVLFATVRTVALCCLLLMTTTSRTNLSCCLIGYCTGPLHPVTLLSPVVNQHSAVGGLVLSPRHCGVAMRQHGAD